MTSTSTITAPVGSGRANEVVLKQLGAIAISAARLELLATEVASALKLSSERRLAADELRTGDYSTPPWCTTTKKDLVNWATAASRLLDTRAAVFAASGSSRFSGTRGDTIATESADGSVFPADEEFLTRLAARFERHLAIGSELCAKLDYRDERGRSWPLVSIYRKAVNDPTPENQLRIPHEWTRWLSA